MPALGDGEHEPEASMTWPVTSADCGDASQVTTGATHGGSKLPRISSGISRSSVRRVSAPGAMALTVTP